MAAVSSGMCSSTSDAIDAVEGPVGEGQRQRVALHRRNRMVRCDLPRLNHGGEGAAHLCHLLGTGVEGHH